MGTGWSVTLPAAGAEEAPLHRECQALLDALVADLSHWDEQSALSRFNRAPRGRWVDLPEALGTVLATALHLARASDGAFDPTIGRLVDLWGFGPPGPVARAPDAAAIAAARSAPGAGWRHVELAPDRRRARWTGSGQLDLSAIAKGHAVDCALEILQQAGLPIGRVNAGGDLRRFGEACETVHVRHPAQETRLLPLCDMRSGAIATSATYYARRLARNATVSPLIDPATRRPCTAMRSVSVMADRCVIADALTKVVFAAPDAAPGTLHRFGAHAIVLDADAAVPGSCRARASTVDGWQALSLATTEASAA
jgi:thiamine biosynthesis lipoprotein